MTTSRNASSTLCTILPAMKAHGGSGVPRMRLRIPRSRAPVIIIAMLV